MTEQAIGHVERQGDTYSLVMEREYPVPLEEVWAALTEPEKLEAWLGTVAINARVGGSFEIDFDGEDQAGGKILRFEPPHALQFEWGETGVSSTVLFELRKTPGGTQLRLTHARQSIEQASRTGAGWHAHLDLFEAALVGQSVEWDDAYAVAKPLYVGSVGA